MIILVLSAVVVILICLLFFADKTMCDLEKMAKDLHLKVIQSQSRLSQLERLVDQKDDDLRKLIEWTDVKIMNLRKMVNDAISEGKNMKDSKKKPVTKKPTPKKK